MSTLSAEETEDLVNTASRLAAENEVAARELAKWQDYEKHAHFAVKAIGGLGVVAAIAAGVAGWRLGSDRQWEAGYKVGLHFGKEQGVEEGKAVGWRQARSEADECPK